MFLLNQSQTLNRLSDAGLRRLSLIVEVLRVYLDEGVVCQRVDLPVEAEAKQTSKQAAHQHSNTQVIPER